ncbi:hypothetical protein C8J55DRAFT_504414 [Lentinula edodes]|uniref:Uncharacterized protein n=1 Tax=Lentinula lateritia TaxID=40482 RepID=A0A9W9AY18_9AGAR|nr:hypothetical protein C8J55DRAFT_504414 [Lentinula edodes]
MRLTYSTSRRHPIVRPNVLVIASLATSLAGVKTGGGGKLYTMAQNMHLIFYISKVCATYIHTCAKDARKIVGRNPCGRGRKNQLAGYGK